jgi:hypothetical protein
LLDLAALHASIIASRMVWKVNADRLRSE